MKNKIYTYLLLGISLVFSGVGHTQTKTINKQTKTKISSTSSLHAKPEKANIKPPPVILTKTIAKTIDKKTASSKAVIAMKVLASKKITVASKLTTKKSAIVAVKLKNSKHVIATPKSLQKNHVAVSKVDARKHTVISSKSIESAPVKSIITNQSHKENQDNLNLDNADPGTYKNIDRPFHPILLERPQIAKINTAHVSIETSLFLDGLEADLSKELILQLTDIFAWDIDFATNLRPGDQFTVVYGKKIINGKETNIDEIIAAEFINQGSSHTAVRYINNSGITSYFTPDGESMQRAFLTTPVDFAKISSPFDMHRMHPILNRIRAHKGIDYAARIGTPVKTTGDGIIIFSGSKGAYGQVIIIQHNEHYETLYAHMSEFKKDLNVGNHVKQGDVIGYVGQSGLATGPHLHYEFHVDGLYRDPESVKIPHSMPISDTLLADFKAQTQPFFAQINQVKAKSLLAKNHPAQRDATPYITPPPATIQPFHYD